MTDQVYVDLNGRKATRIKELGKGKCLLLYHDKAKNVFRLGMFEVDGTEYRPLAGEPREIYDTDPLAETAKRLALELGEEFHGNVTVVVNTPKPKVKKVAVRKTKNSTIKTTQLNE